MRDFEKLFTAQIDCPFGVGGREKGTLVVVEVLVTFTQKRMIIKNNSPIPNLYRFIHPYSRAEVAEGVMSTGINEGVAFALDRETAIRALVRHLEAQCQKAQKALAAAEENLCLALRAE